MSKKFIAPALLSAALLATIVPVEVAHADSVSSSQLTQKQKVHSKNDLKKVLKTLPNGKQIKKNINQYEVIDTQKDAQGFTHYTLKPKQNGKSALNKEVKIHVSPENEVTFVNGDLNDHSLRPLNTTKITKEQAIDKAFNAAGVKKSEVTNMDRSVVKKSDLAINADKNINVYDIQLIYVTPQAANWHIQIDAETGEVVDKQNLLSHATTTGSGIGLKGDKKSLNLYEENGTYYLSDQTRKGNIETYDAHNTQNKFDIVSNYSSIFNTRSHKAAVDSHYYTGVVYDYYKNHHARDSYDGKGAPIYSVVHYGKNYNNAFWNGEAMFYGDGDGRTFSPLSGANDIIAHELTHAVTEKTAGLVYRYQSGALNESMSDVFAYFVDPDFLMGEDVYTPGKYGDALRSLSEPELYNQPSHMKDYLSLPNTEEGDWGGVHINSGIPNKAFYNTVTQLGSSKSEKIYYRALSYYLTPYSDFKDGKAALIQSAKDLYGQTEANIIEKSWAAVGV